MLVFYSTHAQSLVKQLRLCFYDDAEKGDGQDAWNEMLRRTPASCSPSDPAEVSLL